MMGIAHMLTGLLSTKIAIEHGYLPSRPETYVGAVIGSLLLDIDEGHSKINQEILPSGFRNSFGKMIFYLGMAGFSFYLYKNGFALGMPIGLILALIGVSRHRGIIHSLPGIAIIMGMLYYISPPYISILGMTVNMHGLLNSITLNAGIHLFCDMVNVGGVKLFSPFYNKIYRFPFAVHSNSIFARLVEGAVIIALISFSSYANLLTKF